MSLKPAGILLDFDGVVVDSLAAHLAAWGQAWQEVTGTPMEEPFRNSLRGFSTRGIRAKLSERLTPSRAEEIVAAKEKHLLTSLESGIPWMPGARQLLAWLQEEGWPWGIATNSSAAWIDGLLARSNLQVPARTCLEDYRNPKPNPEPYLLCARRAGIPLDGHRHTLVLEDSVHGIRAAAGAGMIPIGIGPPDQATGLRAAGARLILDHPGLLVTFTEMAELLGGSGQGSADQTEASGGGREQKITRG